MIREQDQEAAILLVECAAGADADDEEPVRRPQAWSRDRQDEGRRHGLGPLCADHGAKSGAHVRHDPRLDLRGDDAEWPARVGVERDAGRGEVARARKRVAHQGSGRSFGVEGVQQHEGEILDVLRQRVDGAVPGLVLDLRLGGARSDVAQGPQALLEISMPIERQHPVLGANGCPCHHAVEHGADDVPALGERVARPQPHGGGVLRRAEDRAIAVVVKLRVVAPPRDVHREP